MVAEEVANREKNDCFKGQERHEHSDVQQKTFENLVIRSEIIQGDNGQVGYTLSLTNISKYRVEMIQDG